MSQPHNVQQGGAFGIKLTYAACEVFSSCCVAAVAATAWGVREVAVASPFFPAEAERRSHPWPQWTPCCCCCFSVAWRVNSLSIPFFSVNFTSTAWRFNAHFPQRTIMRLILLAKMPSTQN